MLSQSAVSVTSTINLMNGGGCYTRRDVTSEGAAWQVYGGMGFIECASLMPVGATVKSLIALVMPTEMEPGAGNGGSGGGRDSKKMETPVRGAIGPVRLHLWELQ